MKKLKIFFLLLLICSSAFAQPGNTGMRFSHYGGMMSVYENPAFGANLHTHWEIGLFNINNILENNSVQLAWRPLLQDADLDISNAVQIGANQDFSFRNVFELYGPSVFYSYKKKLSVGVSTRSRLFFQMNNINLDLVDNALDESFNWNTNGQIRDDFFNVNAQMVNDLGLHASLLLLKTKRHMFYIGGTLRFYRGVAALDFTGRNLDLDVNEITSGDSIVDFSANFSLNASVPQDADFLNGSTSQQSFGFNTIFNNAFNESAGKGIGGDIGFVLQSRFLKRSFKAAVSVTDIGAINYNNGIQYSGNFEANNVQIPIDSFENFPSGYDSIRTWAANYGVLVDTGSESFTQALPTRINAYAELQVLKGFHIGASTSLNLSNSNTRASAYSNYIAVIPRWQTRKVETWLPVSYNTFTQQVKAGLGLRASVFHLGTDDILSLARSEVKGVNFYLGVRLAGNYSRRKIKKSEKNKEVGE